MDDVRPALDLVGNTVVRVHEVNRRGEGEGAGQRIIRADREGVGDQVVVSGAESNPSELKQELEGETDSPTQANVTKYAAEEFAACDMNWWTCIPEEVIGPDLQEMKNIHMRLKPIPGWRATGEGPRPISSKGGAGKPACPSFSPLRRHWVGDRNGPMAPPVLSARIRALDLGADRMLAPIYIHINNIDAPSSSGVPFLIFTYEIESRKRSSLV